MRDHGQLGSLRATVAALDARTQTAEQKAVLLVLGTSFPSGRPNIERLAELSSTGDNIWQILSELRALGFIENDCQIVEPQSTVIPEWAA